MKLELSQSLQQQQVLAPQMILSMDILLLPTLDLEQRIRQEFAENPALEVVERDRVRQSSASDRRSNDASLSREQRLFSKLGTFQDQSWRQGYDAPRRRTAGSDIDSKHEALQNTAGRPPGLKEHLIQQLHLNNLASGIQEIAEDIIHNLDGRGYLLCPASELQQSMQNAVAPSDFQAALDAVRSLDPPGVGAEDLQHCLLLQLDRDPQDYPLEKEIITHHLRDLGMNKLPKIAKDLGRTIEEVKEAVEIISSLDPFPGGRIEPERTIYVRPDVVVEVLDGDISVRIDNGSLPDLQVSEACKEILKTKKGNREITDFVRKKVESAQWLIQAIDQRRRTLYDIALSLVRFQRDFMLFGPEHLLPLKMQTLADDVGVHISTISRAIKGKHIQTPFGLFDMRFFFTGGVGTETGEVESRRNVYLRIAEIIKTEDKAHPLSDSDIAKVLRDQGLRIARRTVTKYREQEGIPSSRLRKSY